MYSTPLQFGYFLSLLLALIFWWKAYKEERLNAGLLGFLMLILALSLQDYTFGFSGINILWNEFNGFPREVNLLFGPLLLLYLRAQVNRSFKLKLRDVWHLLPWAVYFLFYLQFFVRGSEIVLVWQASRWNHYIDLFSTFMAWASYGYYFYKSLQLYSSYRAWLNERFSETAAFSLTWFRDFVVLMVVWVSFKEVLNVIDYFLDLEYYQDWWWNLALVGVATYVGLSGLGQRQVADMLFLDQKEVRKTAGGIDSPSSDLEVIEKKLDAKMQEDRFYLQPELTVRELAGQLKVSAGDLSTAINSLKGVNFNDYINAWRINEFIRCYPLPENKSYTILSVALDCGFNSKATFNRAFKKETSMSPKAFFEKNFNKG
jgi:AraC-like DNA-binding protein